MNSFLELHGKESSIGNNNSRKENDLFTLQDEITKQVNDIQSNINSLDNKVRIIYSDGETLKQKLDSIKNESETEKINQVLNEFYHSLQTLKYYQVSYILFN